MRAAVYQRFGPPEVVSVTDIPTPSPRAGEVQVRVAYAAVTSGDARIRAAQFPKGFALIARPAVFGVFGPRRKVLGICFSGTVSAVGSEVTKFKVGDEVCGMTGMKMGAHAEFLVIPQAGALAAKPATVSLADAAAMVFGGTAALYFLRDRAKISSGQRVLVNGASGAVGTNAVQIAKHLGATVTGVCSQANEALVRSLGADEVVAYDKNPLEKHTDTYDLVLDTVGNLNPSNGKRLLTPNGKLALMVATLAELVLPKSYVLSGVATDRAENLEFLLKLVEQGDLTPVIAEVYPFDQIQKAHAHVSTGHKVGNVLVKM
ncbi:MAG: NAD(P)-dependent alcohol dehydrogenase [Fimbriimonadaceae bacterium]|nr:NAD(P)-dependent alcohol dehydrogenase [Fimbriimonadaceae bacterium]